MGIYNCCNFSKTKEGIQFDQEVIRASPKNNKNLTFGFSFDIVNEHISPELNIDNVKESNIKTLSISDDLNPMLSKSHLLPSQDTITKQVECAIKIQRFYKKKFKTKIINIDITDNIYSETLCTLGHELSEIINKNSIVDQSEKNSSFFKRISTSNFKKKSSINVKDLLLENQTTQFLRIPSLIVRKGTLASNNNVETGYKSSPDKKNSKLLLQKQTESSNIYKIVELLKSNSFKNMNDDCNFGIKVIHNKENKIAGLFANKKLNGIGYFESNNYIFKGEYLDNKLNGFGIAKSLVDKNIGYIGEWDNNKKTSIGIEIYSNGLYTGEFCNDMKDGIGVFKFINGNFYEGEFKNNKMNGIVSIIL